MNTAEVKVARTIAAPPEKVFDLWMDPSRPGGPWFGVIRPVINLAVDGLFNFSVEHEGRVWAHYGRFLRIERPGAAPGDGSGVVEYTWVSEATRGFESVVTVTFQPLEDETEVTLHHRKLPGDEMAARHKEGWNWMLNMLAERFTVHEEA